MADSTRPYAGRGTGGGGLIPRRPPDVFTGADRAAAVAARLLYFTTTKPTDYRQFQQNRALAIILRVTGADDEWNTYLGTGAAYDDSEWASRTDAVEGPRGPGPTDAQVDGRLAARGALLAANNLGDVADAAAGLGSLGGLTQAQVDARAAVRYTDTEKAKLAGVAAGAEANLTGAQLVAAINATLGHNDWQSGGLSMAAVAAGITVALTAAVTGNTETGITVTYDAATGKLDFVVAGLSTHSEQYLALKATPDFTPADFLGANGVAFAAGMHTVIAPDIMGSVHFGIARLVADGDLVFLDVDRTGINQITGTTKQAATIEIGGNDFAVWASDDPAGYDGAVFEAR